MRTSENINELATALAKAQGEMDNAVFNKKNPHFGNRYADLAAIRDAIMPELTKNGLSIVQMTCVDVDAGFMLLTRLMHSSGQWMESDYPLLADTNKPQAMASALTYARRYSLSAFVSIASEDDDDGNEADDHGKKAPEIRNIAGSNALLGPKGGKGEKARAAYETLVNEMRKATSLEALREWSKLRQAEVDQLPPDFVNHFDDDYTNHRDELAARV